MAALSKTERALCNKMVSDFDKLINPVLSSKGEVKKKKKELEDKLNGFEFSPMEDVDNGVDLLKNFARDNLPGDTLEDMRDLKSFIDRCPYLNGGPFGANPISMLITCIFGAINVISKALDDLSKNVPEYELGGIGSAINKLLSGKNLPSGKNLSHLLKLADKLIECLAGACGEGDPQYILIASENATKVNDLYSELNIISDPNNPNYGKFDYQTTYDNALIGIDDRLKISKAMNAIDSNKEDTKTIIDKSISRAKEYIKEGFFK